MENKVTADETIQGIERKIHRKNSAEETIRIVLERMTGIQINAAGAARLKSVLIVLAVLVYLTTFTIWSGVPGGRAAILFWIGVVVLILVLIGFGFAMWHLLFRPLPEGQTVRAQPLKVNTRQIMALLLAVGGCAIIVGTFWDEVWHRLYGTPFGADLFWRPHQMIYVGYLVAIGLGFAFLYSWKSAHTNESLQQRFRANPMIGLLILLGAFLMWALPTDPLWHLIYGNDISPWGIPHLLILITFISILLLATAFHMTVQPHREWGTPLQLRLPDVLPLLTFATTSLIWGQFFTAEWDAGFQSGVERPEWVLPLMIVSGAAFIGVMANHTLRVFGAATLVGLLALVIRIMLIRLFDVSYMMFLNAWLLMLPSMLLIDVWYMFRRGYWIGGAVAATAGLGPLPMALALVYPKMLIHNVPVALIMMLVGCLSFSWLGARIGDYFAEGSARGDEVAGSRLMLTLAPLGVTAGMVVFIIMFVLTSRPPLP